MENNEIKAPSLESFLKRTLTEEQFNQIKAKGHKAMVLAAFRESAKRAKINTRGQLS